MSTTPPSEQQELSEALQESSYRAGAKAGYNLGLFEDSTGLRKLLEAHHYPMPSIACVSKSGESDRQTTLSPVGEKQAPSSGGALQVEAPKHEIRSGSDDPIIKWRDCPDCSGRGWFCNNPFAEKSGQRFYQCVKCETTKAYYDKTGLLPFDTAPTPSGASSSVGEGGK